MKPGERKKAVLLAVLLGITAVYWGYGLLSGGETAGRRAVETTARPHRRRPPRTPVRVNLDLLDRPRPDLEVNKNIFTPVYRKPELKKPAPNADAGRAALPPGYTPPPPPPLKTKAQLMAEAAQDEMAKFRFLGFLKRKDRMDVFIALKDAYYVVSEGDTITKGYYLKDIAEDHLTIADAGTGAEAEVAARFTEGENSPAAPPPSVSPARPARPARPEPGGRPPIRSGPSGRRHYRSTGGSPVVRGGGITGAGSVIVTPPPTPGNAGTGSQTGGEAAQPPPLVGHSSP